MARKGPPPSPLREWARNVLRSRHIAAWIVLLITLILGLAFRWALLHEWGARMFPLRQVSVRGAHYVDHKRLQHMLAPMMHGGFFSVHPDEVRESLRALPWVADVMVRRVWPDRVLIDIRERQPVAHWNKKSLLSAAGDIFTPDNPPAFPGLPAFYGPSGSQMRVLACHQALKQALMPLRTEVASLQLTSLLSWEVVLQNGIRIHLGSHDILTHLSHFVKVYASVVGNRAAKVEYVDLRYPDGFAVRWKKQA